MPAVVYYLKLPVQLHCNIHSEHESVVHHIAFYAEKSALAYVLYNNIVLLNGSGDITCMNLGHRRSMEIKKFYV